MMKNNVGSIERLLRILIGAALVAWAYFGNVPWAYLGVVPLLTGLIGWCPPYAILGINTCKMKNKE